METITLKKYRGRGNNYLILDPNKNDIHLQERNIEMLCKRNFGSNAVGLLYGPILDDGKIVSCGTHDELMQTSPIYREVYESQTKGDPANATAS